jgi:hypothetical protein
MQRDLVRLSILALPLLAATACAAGPLTVTTQAAGCASLIPPEWRGGVDGAELPSGDTVGDWIAFADAQTGKLDQANDRTSSTIGIVERCEVRDAAAVRQATRRRFLGIF